MARKKKQDEKAPEVSGTDADSKPDEESVTPEELERINAVFAEQDRLIELAETDPEAYHREMLASIPMTKFEFDPH